MLTGWNIPADVDCTGPSQHLCYMCTPGDTTSVLMSSCSLQISIQFLSDNYRENAHVFFKNEIIPYRVDPLCSAGHPHILGWRLSKGINRGIHHRWHHRLADDNTNVLMKEMPVKNMLLMMMMVIWRIKFEACWYSTLWTLGKYGDIGPQPCL